MKQLLVVYEFYPEQIEELKDVASRYEVITNIEEINTESLEIIVGWSDELESFIQKDESNVKWIQYPYAGVNSLPLDLFEDKGILLTNGSGIHAHSVSESTMGMILAMTRNIIVSAKDQTEEKWGDVGNLYELFGKTIMIVGAGKIGIHLGQIAKGFGMKTIGINRSGDNIKNMDEQYIQNEMKDVIGKADIVVNILPATKETQHIFDVEMFSQMKEKSIFINVGRGETVDTGALMEALDSDQLLFVGLDVFEEEPLPANHPLWKHEKVLVTPHIAGRVESYPNHFYSLLMTNIKSYMKDGTLSENVVTLDSGY